MRTNVCLEKDCRKPVYQGERWYLVVGTDACGRAAVTKEDVGLVTRLRETVRLGGVYEG